MAYTNLNTKELVSDISKIDPNALYTDEAGKTVTGKYVQGGYGNTINSSVLNPSPAPNFQSPTPTSPYPVAGLSPKEEKAQNLFDKIGGLYQGLLGESAYKSQQEQEAGLMEFEKTKKDLTSRLNTLKNEALAIPLQLQQDATGRGITKGGLQPHETGALRTNAIQSLSTASLLEATNGNITTALDLVDRAVAQKYDPIREEIAVATANLELVLNSPEYSKAVKDRAQAELDRQNKLKEETDKKAADETEIGTLALKAAQNGADSLTLKKIQEAATPEEALRIAVDAGFVEEVSAPQVIGTAETGYRQYDPKTNTWKPIPGMGGSGNTASEPSADDDNFFNQIKNRNIKFSALPADEKKRALRVFAARGESIPRELTAKEISAADDAISGIDAVTRLRDMFSANKLPLIRDRIFGDSVLGRFFGTSQFQNAAKEAADIKTRIRTGAALNESEIKFYASQTPKLGDSPEDIKKKLDHLEGFYLGMSGLPVTITNPETGEVFEFDDLFNNKQRLGLKQAINAGFTLSY